MTREEAYEWNNNSHDLKYCDEMEDVEESMFYCLKKIYDHHEAVEKKANSKIIQLEEGYTLISALFEGCIKELKSEREIKDYLVKEFRKDKKKHEAELNELKKELLEEKEKFILEDTVTTDSSGYMPDYPQLGRFNRLETIEIFTKVKK